MKFLKSFFSFFKGSKKTKKQRTKRIFYKKNKTLRRNKNMRGG